MENEITLWQTDHWIVALAEDQTYLGRAVVILKRDPCPTMAELRDEEVLDFWHNVVRTYETALKKAFGAEMFNWSCLMNNAYQNTPPDPHVHWHAIPRYRHAVEFSGEKFVDEKFGHHYIPLVSLTPRILSGDLRRQMAEKILAAKD